MTAKQTIFGGALALSLACSACATTANSQQLFSSALRAIPAQGLRIAEKDKSGCFIATEWRDVQRAGPRGAVKERFVFTCENRKFDVTYEAMAPDPYTGELALVPEVPAEKQLLVRRLSSRISAGVAR